MWNPEVEYVPLLPLRSGRRACPRSSSRKKITGGQELLSRSGKSTKSGGKPSFLTCEIARVPLHT